MKNVIRKGLECLINVFIAFYFAYIIAQKTEIGIASFFCIVAYFFVVVQTITYMFQRKYPWSFSFRRLMLYIGISIIFFVIGHEKMLSIAYQDAEIQVTALGTKNIKSNSYEVWIGAISANEEYLDMSTIALEDGWIMRDGCLLSNNGTERATFTFSVPQMEKVTIPISKFAWCGFVEIRCGEIVKTIDLYSEVGTTEFVELIGHKQLISIENVLAALGVIFLIVKILVLCEVVLKLIIGEEYLRKLFGLVPYALFAAIPSYYVINSFDVNAGQKFFLFLYFGFLFVCLLLYIKKRSKESRNIKKWLLYFILATSLICIGNQSFLKKNYQNAEVKIVALGEKNNLSNSYEIWISQIKANGIDVDFSTLSLEDGWIFKDGCLLANAGEQKTELCFNIENMENFEITFGKHSWSGKVKVITVNGEEEIDLYSETGGRYTTTFEGKYRFGIKEIVELFSAMIAMLVVLMFLSSIKKCGIAITNVIIFGVMCQGELQGLFKHETIILYSIMIFVAKCLFDVIKKDKCMEGYFSLKGKISLMICAFYMAFAFCGQYLFISGDGLDVNVAKAITLILGCVIIYPLVYTIVYILRKLGANALVKNNRKQSDELKIILISFASMFLILLFFAMGYYPGNMTSDGVDQWAQALGRIQLNDAHPVIHTLFLRLCSKLGKTPFSVVVVQIALFSGIWSKIFAFLYGRGLKKRIIYFITVVIACMPNNYLMISLISKNVLYAILVLWSTYLLARMICEGKNFFQWFRVVEFSIVLALIYTVRHNGFLSVYAIYVMILVWMIFKYKKVSIKPLAVIGLSVLLIFGIKGPLYKMYGISSTTNVMSVQGSLLTPVGAFYLADKDIPNSIKSKVDAIGTKEQWLANYNPYNGDKFGWGELRSNILNTSTKDGLHIFFTLLAEEPLLVIKDRLNGLDLMWNILEPQQSFEKYGAYSARYAVGIWPPPSLVNILPDLLNPSDMSASGEAYFRENFITNISNNNTNGSLRYQWIESVIWRNGIYLVLVLVIFSMNLVEKKNWDSVIMISSIATLVTLALVISLQIYQYYWFFPLTAIFFFLYILTRDDENSMEARTSKKEN